MQGQGRARRKDCLHNPLLQDLELVDPDKPSSWQAQQIAAQLSDEELEDESATDCEAQEDRGCATGGPARYHPPVSWPSSTGLVSVEL